MDRNQVIAKIKSILNLQNGTDFDGEASAAANLIDKLCKQYNVSLDEATKTQILDECFYTFKRMNQAYVTLLNAVATFYDAKVYIRTSNTGEKSIQVVGSEAQQIQTKIYYEYLLEVMEKQCEVAHKAEKVLCQLNGVAISRSFKINFRKAFANKVAFRLEELKEQEGRVHDDAEATNTEYSKLKLGKARKFTAARGDGAYAGHDVGSNVSLHRQASGKSNRLLSGV